MTYREGITAIPQQFAYQPEILHKEKLRPFQRIIVLGMGGSRLGADILNMIKPEMDIYVHSDFDLPPLGSKALSEALIVANSYSGNTAEPISGAMIAMAKKFNLAIVATGGELIDIASQNNIPHIILPPTGLPPRMMVGHDLLALAAILDIQPDIFKSCQHIDSAALEAQGKEIAGQIKSSVPLVYTSNRLNELGYIWKVIFNETAKIPAFNNRFPELDHNEIVGFEPHQPFHCLMLNDGLDSRIGARMAATADLLRQKSIPVTILTLDGASLVDQIISSVILAHWTALTMAEQRNVDPLATPVIEEFKKSVK